MDRKVEKALYRALDHYEDAKARYNRLRAPGTDVDTVTLDRAEAMMDDTGEQVDTLLDEWVKRLGHGK